MHFYLQGDGTNEIQSNEGSKRSSPLKSKPSVKPKSAVKRAYVKDQEDSLDVEAEAEKQEDDVVSSAISIRSNQMLYYR